MKNFEEMSPKKLSPLQWQKLLNLWKMMDFVTKKANWKFTKNLILRFLFLLKWIVTIEPVLLYNLYCNALFLIRKAKNVFGVRDWLFQIRNKILSVGLISIFKISISPQMNRNNRTGIAIQSLLLCSIFDKEGKECFWSKGLAVSNKKQDSFYWFDFYGIESYEQSIQEIKEIISQHFYLL